MIARYVSCVTAAALEMWVIAGLWHNLIVPTFYADAGHAEHKGIGVLLLSYAILAALMTYLYGRGAPAGFRLLNGFAFGGLIGFLWVFPHELALAAAHGDSYAYVFRNGAWHVIEQGLGGIVIALLWHALRPRHRTQTTPRAMTGLSRPVAG
jgi:hypothetical protein